MKNNIEFQGTINRVAGNHLIVAGLLTYPDNCVSYVENYFLPADQISKIFECLPQEREMINEALNYSKRTETYQKLSRRGPRREKL